MAVQAYRVFPDGFRLIDGTKLNKLFQGNQQMQAINVSGTSTLGVVNASGLVTASGGLSITGAQKQTPSVVAAAGATQGNATAIPAAASIVICTVTASTEGVKLPTAATGRVVEVYASPTVGVKVYAAAAGQKIGTATTATTAYGPIPKNTSVQFLAQNTTQWLVSGKGT